MARMLAPLFVALLLVAQSVSAGPAHAIDATHVVAIEGGPLALGTMIVATGRPAVGNRTCDAFALTAAVYSVATGAGAPRLSYWQGLQRAGSRFTLVANLGPCGFSGSDVIWGNLYLTEPR